MAWIPLAPQLNEFVLKTKERQRAVVAQSISEVIELMQTPIAKGGNLPVDTGFLRASLVLSTGGFAGGTTKNPGGDKTFTYSGAENEIVLASFQIGDTVFGQYTANYAVYVHNGANGVPGRPWVTLAAMNFQRIVDDVSARLEQRINSGN